MTFQELLSTKIREHPLVTITLDIDTLQTTFEEICMRLDLLDKRLHETEETVATKANEKDLREFQKSIEQKMNGIQKDFKFSEDTMRNHNQQIDEKIKKLEEDMERQIGACLVEAGTLVRDSIEQQQPDLLKSILESMPNINDLNAAGDERNHKLNDLQKQLENLSKSLDDLNGKQIETKNEVDDINVRLADLAAQSISNSPVPQTPVKMITPDSPIDEDLRYISEEDLQKLRDELFQAIHFQNEKVDELRTECKNSKLYTDDKSADLENKLKDECDKLRDQIDQLNVQSTDYSSAPVQSSVEIPSDLVDKLVSHGKEIEDLKRMLAELSDRQKGTEQALSDVREAITETPEEAPPVTVTAGEGGEIDLSPVFNRIAQQEKGIKMAVARIEALEARDSVSPSAFEIVANIVKELQPRVDGTESSLKGVQDQMVKERERVDRRINSLVDPISRKADESKATAESAKRDVEAVKRDISKLRSELGDTNYKLTELAQPKEDPAIEKLQKALSNLQTDLARLRAQLEGVKKGETTSSTGNEFAADIVSIRSELKDLWAKIEELARAATEERDFIPKSVDLGSSRDREKENKKPRVDVVVERSALPRISSPQLQFRADDGRLDATASKVDRQENLLTQLKRAVEAQQKQLKELDDSKADKIAAQSLFEQFRIAMGELNNRLSSVRRALVGKADSSEIYSAINAAMGNGADDTAAGVEPIRCIACGRPRSFVTGVLDDSQRRVPVPMSTRIYGDSDGQVCFVYGDRGEMYIGRSQDGKSRFGRAEEQPPQTPTRSPKQ